MASGHRVLGQALKHLHMNGEEGARGLKAHQSLSWVSCQSIELSAQAGIRVTARETGCRVLADLGRHQYQDNNANSHLTPTAEPDVGLGGLP